MIVEPALQPTQPLEIASVPFIGPKPVARWVGIGVARKMLEDTLGLAFDEAASLLWEHLGLTIPFRFARWTFVVSIEVEGLREQSMVQFNGRDGAPNLDRELFRGLFFYGDNVDKLQWSGGTFGGLTGARWRTLVDGHRLTIHEFAAHGAVVDALALCRAFGIPHDETALVLPSSEHAESPQRRSEPNFGTDFDLPTRRRRGRTPGTGFEREDAPLVAEMIEMHRSGKVPSLTKAAESVVSRANGASHGAIVVRLVARAKRAKNNVQ